MITKFKHILNAPLIQEWECFVDGNFVRAQERFELGFDFSCQIEKRKFRIFVIPRESKDRFIYFWENSKRNENQFRQKFPEIFSQIMEMRTRMEKLRSFE